ncbi:MAG: NAD(P)-dependent oxidoreductase [Candidatus Melainabacteria bacterium]|nr:MAG: NAD(P)-dependent oxidoreductase [Candidatus Melainabacteria bacterium]
MKVAIVTGASRGIGACVAEGLATGGFSQALVARSKKGLDQVAERIAKNGKSKGADVLTFPVDIQDADKIEQVVSNVVAKFGRIDLLFNNAGLGCLGTLEVPLEEFDQVMNVNLRGAFCFLKFVVPIMKKQGSGTIINVSSRAGKIGFEGYGTYAATKFGLVGLSESLYRELAPLGIRVTALCPSWVDTDMAEHSDLPSEEMISPTDILKTINWIMDLSPAAVVKEVMIECRKQIA